jgi:serine/threonine-protein kinase RsbW
MSTPLDRDTLEMRIPCETRFLSVVRLTVAGVAARSGLGVAEVDDVKVAISEACTNVIEHAYDASTGGHCGLIHIRMTSREGELRLEIEDEGAGFDPKRLPKVDIEERVQEEGGLGIYLMRQLMDEVKIESAPGSGTKIIMVKRVAR